jgi:hypothetical protein
MVRVFFFFFFVKRSVFVIVDYRLIAFNFEALNVFGYCNEYCYSKMRLL